MTSRQRALYIHGGPGFNSEAERRALSSRFQVAGVDVHFWDEPSKLRPEGAAFELNSAFGGWLRSIDAAIETNGPFDVLIGCSFGALAALHVLQRRPASFNKLIMIGPTLDLTSVFRRMMDLAVSDFSKADPKVAADILRLKALSKHWTDSAAQQAIAMVNRDALLVLHYWVDSTKMGEWAAVLSEPRFGVDSESQAAVLADFARASLPRPSAPNTMPVAVMYGVRDPVWDAEVTRNFLEPWFKEVKQYRFGLSGHFLQLEEPDAFVRAIREFCSIGA